MTFAYVMEISPHFNRCGLYNHPGSTGPETDTAEIKEWESDLKPILKKIQRKAEIGKYILQGRKQINLTKFERFMKENKR